jgi:predicted transposase/invertase (TIGR01784 family)
MAAKKTKKPKSEPKDREIIKFDYAIKNILREKANFDILGGLLTELLGRKVTVMELLESEGNIDDPDEKTNRVDLKAKIDGGEIAIFEVQFATEFDFLGKLLFNVSRAVVEQVSKGAKYDIKKVYMISIANFELGAKRDYLFAAKMDGFKGVHFEETIPFSQTRGGVAETEKKLKRDIHPEYHLILPEMFDEQIRSRFDEWVYTLKNGVVKSEFKAAGLQEAAEKLDRLNMTPEQQKAYDKFIRNRTDINTSLETRWVEGKVEGRAEGLAEGRAEGLAEGRAEGLAEGIAKVAKNLKNGGMPTEKIAEITGLSIEEVESL